MGVNLLPKTVTRQRCDCDLIFFSKYAVKRLVEFGIIHARHVCKQADMSQLNLPHETNDEKVEKQKDYKVKNGNAHKYR